MTVLISAVIAVLAAQTALAEQRANKPFNTVNGRTSTAAPAAPRVFTVNTPGGGASANAGAPQATSSGGGYQTFYGGGRQAVSRTSSNQAVRRGGKTFWSGGRRVDGGGTTSTEEAPPNFSKPGALIRTTGQQPVYEKAETRTHTTDAGEIVMNKRKAFDVTRAPSVQQGPKDTLPPPNPTTGGYGSGAAANSGPVSGGNGGGRDNNGSGNNGKDKPGDDDDGHGGDRARETSFNDAF
jgi:hypothetical protein